MSARRCGDSASSDVVGSHRARARRRRPADRSRRTAVRAALTVGAGRRRPTSVPSAQHPARHRLSRPRRAQPGALGRPTVIGLAGAATLLAYLVGMSIGLVAGISRSLVGSAADARSWTCSSRFRRSSCCSFSPPAPAPARGCSSSAWRSRTFPASPASCARRRSKSSVQGLCRGGRRARRASPFMLGREILPNIALADPGRRRRSAYRLDPACRRLSTSSASGSSRRPPTGR